MYNIGMVIDSKDMMISSPPSTPVSPGGHVDITGQVLGLSTRGEAFTDIYLLSLLLFVVAVMGLLSVPLSLLIRSRLRTLQHGYYKIWHTQTTEEDDRKPIYKNPDHQASSTSDLLIRTV